MGILIHIQRKPAIQVCDRSLCSSFHNDGGTNHGRIIFGGDDRTRHFHCLCCHGGNTHRRQA